MQKNLHYKINTTYNKAIVVIRLRP